MAEHEWFFSALAQSSAAIIGFVFAFSAVLHQIEQQQINDRTDDLREELIKLQSKYAEIIDVLLFALMDLVDTDTSYLTDIDLHAFDFKKELDKDTDLENPGSAYVWGLLYRISTLLKGVGPSEDPNAHYLLTKQELDVLFSSAVALDIVFSSSTTSSNASNENGVNRRVIDAVAQEINGSSKVSPTLELFDDYSLSDGSLTTDKKNKVKEWLDTNLDVNQHEPPTITGNNIYSFSILFDRLSNDVREVTLITHGTKISHESSVQPILMESLGLVIVGVFLPLASLFTYPQNIAIFGLSDQGLLLYQASLLLLSAVFAVHLFYKLVRNANS